MGIGLILGCLAPAFGAGVPWFVGEPVAQVSLEASSGGLPEENLEPLLRTQAGEALTVGTLRSDVALLVSAGGFLSVEALVEPWVTVDQNGMPEDAVKVVYRVVSAPKIRALQITGVRGTALKAAERGLDVDLGDAWFGESEQTQIERSVTQSLKQSGWPMASVRVGVDIAEGDVRLSIDVSPEKAQRVGNIRIGGQLPVDAKQIRRWLRRSGLREGRRFDESKADAARTGVVERLRQMGWGRPRVNLFVQDRTDPNELGISVLISAGPRLVLDAQGRQLPGNQVLSETMGLRAGDRVTDNSLADAASRLTKWYGQQGYRDAQVDVAVVESQGDSTRISVVAKPGRRHWLKGLDFRTDMPISTRDARSVIDDATDGSLAERVVSDEGVLRAERALKERLRADGYWDATVSIEESRGTFGPGFGVFRWGVPVELTVDVDPGDVVRLASVRVRGGNGVEAERVAKWRVNNLNGPLRSVELVRLESDIVDAYEEQGFLDVDATVSTVRNRAAGNAAVDVKVSPGEALSLRSVVIRGNRRTRRHVIHREVVIEPGSPISPEGISATRSNLYNLDLFRQVSPELVGDEPDVRDLVLTVAERSNILLEAGGGVSTDQGVTVTGRATHRNLYGRAHRLTALGSVGYGWDGDEWRLNTDTPVWRSAARYEIPYVPGRGGRLVTEALFNEAVQEPSWRLSRTGGTVGMKMRLSDRSEAMLDYRVQVRRLVDVDPGVLVNGDPWVPYLGLDNDLSGDPILTSEARVISGGGLLVVHDQRDDRFNPSQGGLWSAQIEFGDGAFTGNVTMRATAKAERLIPIGGVVLDLVGRGGIGFAQGRAVTLPLEERFFLGGGSSLRGFSTDSIGPANFSTRPEVDHPNQTEPLVDGLGLPRDPGHWVATGGDAMAAATIELRVPLSLMGFESDGTSVVVFSDAGNVLFLDPTVVTSSILEGRDPLLRYSFGAGLRLSTPVGPASFDLGINPNRIAERNEPWILPHLSLGVL